MKKSIISMLVVVNFLLGGCEDTTLVPNKATCIGDAYQEALSEISNEVKRQAFVAECESFLKAQKMTEWEFKSSPEDNF